MTSPGPDTPDTPPQGGSGDVDRPEPVVGAAAVASALTSLAGLVLLVLALTHVITPDGQAVLGPALASAIPTVVGAVSTLVAAYRARAKVTPLSDPVSAAGVKLVEVTSRAVRPPGPQHPDVADHAAPEVTNPPEG